MGVALRHFKALSKKNYIVWKRNLVSSICELMCPIILMSVLLWARTQIEKELIEETSLLDQASLWHPQVENTPTNDIYQFLNINSSL